MLIPLDIDGFRANFVAYEEEVYYPVIRLNAQYEIGKCYIADNDCTFPEVCREYALQLILAHLLNIQDKVSNGATTQTVTSATEGAVSVTLVEPPSTSSWGYWLSTTPYGLQLLGMLEAYSIGGFYVGGSRERAGFRKIGGGF